MHANKSLLRHTHSTVSGKSLINEEFSLVFQVFLPPLQINGLCTFVHTSVFLATQCIFFFPLRTFSVGQTKSSGCLLFHSSILVLMQLCTFKGAWVRTQTNPFSRSFFGVVFQSLFWKLSSKASFLHQF